MKFMDNLTNEEKLIYEKILKTIEKNPDFYIKASPEEKTKLLLEQSGLTEREVYSILKKITDFKINM